MMHLKHYFQNFKQKLLSDIVKEYKIIEKQTEDLGMYAKYLFQNNVFLIKLCAA